MAYKIQMRGAVVEVDLTTPTEERDPNRRSWGSENQFVKAPPQTEVYFGNLHVHVSMLDLGLAVAFDPYEGNWKDGHWAREQAFEALKNNMTQELWLSLFQTIIEAGKKAGRNEVRKGLKDLLTSEY